MLERWLRGIAGTMVLLGMFLAYEHSPMWLLLPAVIGANLVQSAFTDW
jgi:hypothetical protein